MANPTTNLNITLPVPGSSSSKGTWGETINDAVQSLDTGIAERGVPAGGTDNQMLTKNGTTDYSTQWTNTITGNVIFRFVVGFANLYPLISFYCYAPPSTCRTTWCRSSRSSCS